MAEKKDKDVAKFAEKALRAITSLEAQLDWRITELKQIRSAAQRAIDDAETDKARLAKEYKDVIEEGRAILYVDERLVLTEEDSDDKE